MACTVAMQHAGSKSLLVTMEEWAAKQPAALPDALEAVERISELLDLSGLFSALLLHPRRDRKSLSYTGGIQVSGSGLPHSCSSSNVRAASSISSRAACRQRISGSLQGFSAQSSTCAAGQRPSVSFATDERSRLFWGRAETDLVEQLAAASERVFDAKLTPEAAAALCEAIARRRLDAESQAAGPRALLERRRHVCGPPRRAGPLRRAR